MSSSKPMTLPTPERLRSLLDYEPETGTLRWKVARGKGVRAGDAAGVRNDRGYKYVSVDNFPYKATRVIWAIVTGAWPAGQIDHIDRDTWNDRWSNLRDATASQNQHNQESKGYCWDAARRKWMVRIRDNNTVTFVGRFDSEAEARQAYLAVKQKHLP